MKNLPPRHPLRQARWYWPQSLMYLYNHFAQFRRDFELSKVPAAAPFFITADKEYRLWVNGRYVCRGPARGYQAHWPYDEVDLAPFLQPGHNWLAVEAYNPGISTFQYLHAGRAGLLCAPPGRAPGNKQWAAAWEKAPWQMRRSPAHRTQTARYSLQLDFQEHVDLAADDRSWIYAAQPPENWNPNYYPEGSQQFLDFPFGQWPYDTVEARGIPLLRETRVTPQQVTCHAFGPCAADYASWENVSWGWYEEMKQVTTWQPGTEVPAKVEDGALVVEVAPAGGSGGGGGGGGWHAVTIDLGQMIVGHLEIQAQGACGGEIVDFQHYQCLRDGIPRMLKPGEGCAVAMANRLQLAPGSCRHEFFHPLGFRHVTLIVREASRPITLRLQARSIGYPFTMTGQFDSSDATLNGIHTACRRTQQLCALDAYVDTPWREQAQWWGDARVQAANTFHLDGDPRLLARGIRSLAGQTTSFGLTFGHAPTVAGSCILPDFALTWILTNWDYYWQTGDTTLARQMWPTMKRVLGYFRTREARGLYGLLRHDRRYWYFGDWAQLCKDEIPTFLNLWYLVTLDRLIPLLTAAGKPSEAAHLEAERRGHTELVLKHLFDPGQQLFIAGLNAQGQPVEQPAVHEQTLALLLNLCPQAHETMIHQRLLPYLADQDLPGARPSAFWSTYVLEEMGRRGYGAQGVDFIRRHWQPMLSTGTTWEGFDWNEEHGWSCSHAWTAHPSYHLVQILGGIRQTGVAWSTISFAPQFLPGLERVHCRVPSPKGPIEVQWQREGAGIRGILALPEGVSARPELPGQAAQTWAPGTHAFACTL